MLYIKFLNIGLTNCYIFSSGKSCPKRDPPINGAVSCLNIPGLKYCTVSCNDKYTFNGPFAVAYLCGTTSTWRSSPNYKPVMWPDCTSKFCCILYRLPPGHYCFSSKMICIIIFFSRNWLLIKENRK